jgi:hypothetical protein
MLILLRRAFAPLTKNLRAHKADPQCYTNSIIFVAVTTQCLLQCPPRGTAQCPLQHPLQLSAPLIGRGSTGGGVRGWSQAIAFLPTSCALASRSYRFFPTRQPGPAGPQPPPPPSPTPKIPAALRGCPLGRPLARCARTLQLVRGVGVLLDGTGYQGDVVAFLDSDTWKIE